MKALDADRARDHTRVRTRGPFLGRSAELRQLTDALDAAEGGRGAVFLIEGEAGIGKTRLAEAIAEEAVARGDAVLWGAAWESGGAPPYWPWTQAIRDLMRERTTEELADDLGAGAAHVAQIAPELTRRVGLRVEHDTSADTETARFMAFDAITSFLCAAAARTPLLIVLDSLHAADAATVRLLEFLANGLRYGRILAIATSRSEPARRESDLTEALSGLGAVARRLTLGGLSRAAVAELANAHSPTPPPPLVVERLHALTAGNPLFLDELIRLLNAEGGLDAPGLLEADRLPVPDAVRETIRRRLAPVEPEVIAALRAAAVIGPVFQLGTLARVLAEDRAAVLEHLDVAAAAGLVEELSGASFSYRFANALIRETLYDDLAVQARTRLHAAVGEALVEIYGDSPELPLSEVAHHFLQAARAGDPGRAADYATLAAERALETMAYEHAVDLFRDALRALELQPPDERRGQILLKMGKAEMRAGRLVAGRATMRSAASEARRRGDATLLARAALASAPWGLATGMADEEGLIPLLHEALGALPATDSPYRARLLARVAAAEYWTSPIEQREAQCQEAIAIARRLDDPATLAFVLSDTHRATWSPDSPVRALPWADEIYALSERTGHTELGMVARSWRISLLLELGRVSSVDIEVKTFADEAQRLGQQRAKAQALLHACARRIIDGRFAEAEQLLGEIGGFGSLLEQDPLMLMRIGALGFVMREVQWRLPELEDGVRHFAATYPAMPVWQCGLLTVHLQAGREDELRREYERFAASGFDAMPRDNLWLPALALLAEVCAHVGDRTGAAELLQLLQPYAGHNVVTPDVALVGPVDRYLALLAATVDAHTAASAWFASAGRLARSMGARPTLARLALDEARMLRERDPVTSAVRATEAVALAEELGLEALATAAAALAGTRVPAAKPAPVLVTQRPTGRFRRRGEIWEVSGSGAPFHLKDAKGLQHLARLLASPGREFHVLELTAADNAAAPAGSYRPEPGLAVRARGDDAGALLDSRAKAEYRQAIADLREEIAEAESFNDPERASHARAELDFFTRELSAAVGLGGRDRRASASSERARVNVTRALRTAVDRIAEHDASLGHHLRTCVRTGTFCIYDPGPDPLVWELDRL